MNGDNCSRQMDVSHAGWAPYRLVKRLPSKGKPRTRHTVAGLFLVAIYEFAIVSPMRSPAAGLFSQEHSSPGAPLLRGFSFKCFACQTIRPGFRGCDSPSCFASP
jgi:hypothetical protein